MAPNSLIIIYCRKCKKRCRGKVGLTQHLRLKPECRSVVPKTEVFLYSEDPIKAKATASKIRRLTNNQSPGHNPSEDNDLPPGPVDTFPAVPSDESFDDDDSSADNINSLVHHVEQVHVYQPDEENDLSSIPEDEHDPTDLTELGTCTFSSPPVTLDSNNPNLVEPQSPAQGTKNYSLIPCPDFVAVESPQISRTTPRRQIDLCMETQANIELLKMLSDLGAPLRTYQDIIRWAKKHSSHGYNFDSSRTTYGSMISHLQKTFRLQEYRPTINHLRLPCPAFSHLDYVVAEVVTFDFTKLLHSLLSDPELNTIENLTVDPSNPFAEYPTHRRNHTTNQMETIPLSEVHTAAWYHRTWRKMQKRSASKKTKFNKNFMIGIILYTDNSVVNTSGGLCAHPVNFTLTIFNEKCRRNPKAWRTLGLIPQKAAYELSSSTQRTCANINNWRYQILMEKILESHAQAQEHWALNGITIHLAGYTMRNVNLYVPLAYIIADVEEAQAITSFFTSRGVNGISPRICRTCDVSLDNACRTTEECHRYEQKEIRELYNNEEKEKLHDIQQRYVFNTFYLIDMGDDKHGIYGKCHTELLHALEEGIIKYLLEILVETVLKPSHLVTFDEYIRCMCCQLGDHGKDNFPRTSWKNGFTKLSYLDAGDRVGKLFTATLFLLSQTGAEIFDKFNYTMDRLNRKQSTGSKKKKKSTKTTGSTATNKGSSNKKKKKKNQTSGRSSKKQRASKTDDNLPNLRCNIVEVFEMILCLWSWLKQEEFWHPGDEEYESYVNESIKTLINKMNELLPRGEGVGWLITKVHELLHIVFDIKEFGAHTNVNSDKCESSHKHLIKEPARNAQRRVVSLDRSIASRQVDRLIIDHAFSHLQHQNNRAEEFAPNNAGNKPRTTRGLLTLEKTDDYQYGAWKYNLMHKWADHRYNQSGMRFYDYINVFTSILRLARTDLSFRWDGNNNSHWRTITEAKTDKGLLLRCHPDYRSGGPWYDWVLTREKKIGKLVAIVDPLGSAYDDGLEGATPKYAIIKPMLEGSMLNHSVLTRSFKLHPTKYDVIPFNSILDTPLCAPQDFGPNIPIDFNKTHLYVLPREEWAKQFASPPKEFHDDSSQHS